MISHVQAKQAQAHQAKTHSMTQAKSLTASGQLALNTRFGLIEVDPAKSVQFIRGLLGMPGRERFVLTGFPNPSLQQFTLLQSLDDEALSFITLPVELRNPFIEEHDLVGAAQELDIRPNDLVTLLIVTVHRSLDATRISVNARAPLLVDAKQRQALQYVFLNDRYKVQQMMG